MRRKPLPPPPADASTVREAQAAVPLVPGSEDDCCVRIQDRLGLPGRDDAATWLAFLRTLGLAEETRTGFARVRAAPDVDALGEAFLDGVFGAREVLGALEASSGPLDVAAVAERTAGDATAWERGRHGADWPDVWRDRTAALLGWLVLLGLADRADGGYRSTRAE